MQPLRILLLPQLRIITICFRKTASLFFNKQKVVKNCNKSRNFTCSYLHNRQIYPNYPKYLLKK